MEDLIMTEEAMRASAKAIDRKGVRDKILACLYAGGLGDALGYTVEFSTWNSIKNEFGAEGIRDLVPRGEKAVVSDDTQMTLFTAEGMYMGFFRANERGVGAPVERYIYESYLCWLETQGTETQSLWKPVSKLLGIPEMNHRRAPGNTCLSALWSGQMGTIEDRINNSKGCGGVMRTAPLGFMRARFSGQAAYGPALENGARAAAITHGHPMGWIPAGMFSDIIDRCLYGRYESLGDIVEDSLKLTKKTYGEYPEFPAYEMLIRRAVDLAAKNKGAEHYDPELNAETIHSLGGGWVGDEALAIAIYSVLCYDHDVKACLRSCVNHSGDADSTGAIAGNILGAWLGLAAIPQDWLAELELTGAMEEIADCMYRAITL